MSKPPEYENGANGVNGAHGATGSYGAHGAHPDGGPQDPPNVYHPQPESAPSYEEYADPAVAHGWLNAYDETSEMPRVVGDTHELQPVADEPREVRRAGAGRRARRKPSPWRSRRTAVAAGAVGAVSAALIAGFSFAGSSSGPAGGAQGKEESTTPAAGDSAGPTAPESGGAATGRSSGGGADSSGTASPSPSASTSGTPSGDATREPSTGTSGATATSAPAPSRSVSGPGNSGNNPGHGQGGTKGPK
ncbi:hypothetical protein [Streptomyces sp. NPDC001401]|uniref:hypothetical protein n=1 Tax=Streptomyces sp. NPDC001401 TaxID=3364570 RepID=UPI003684D9A6